MSTFNLVKGETGRILEITVTDSDGDAVDISGKTITFYMWKGSTTVIDGGSTSFTTDGSNGKVYYDFAETDVDTEGIYEAQFYNSTDDIYYPTTSILTIFIAKTVP